MGLWYGSGSTQRVEVRQVSKEWWGSPKGWVGGFAVSTAKPAGNRNRNRLATAIGSTRQRVVELLGLSNNRQSATINCRRTIRNNRRATSVLPIATVRTYGHVCVCVYLRTRKRATVHVGYRFLPSVWSTRPMHVSLPLFSRFPYMDSVTVDLSCEHCLPDLLVSILLLVKH